MLIFLQGIFAFVTLAFLIFLVVRLVVNIDFKLIGIVALILVLLVGVSYLLPDIIPQPAVLPAADNPIDTADTEPPDKDSQMLQTSQALIWIIIFLITAGLAVVLFNLIQGWGSASPQDSELIRSAEEALTAFHEGMDLRNVILRCYFQMTNTLLTEQGIEREAAMTVWEFEERLQQKGYPAAPITQLTSLFEKIRYGEQDFSPEEEDKALDSLNQIITHAKRNREHQQ